MDSAQPSPSATRVEPLAWDSAEFGFGVGRLTTFDAANPSLNHDRLTGEHYAALVSARAAGLRLVYLESPELTPVALAHAVDAADLASVYTDDRVAYAKSLTESQSPIPPGGLQLRSSPPGLPTPALLALGLQAGHFSRFRKDPRFPEPAFVRLYSEWTRRSALRQVCSEVLIAEPLPSTTDGPLGFITVVMEDEAASIGLIAVHPNARNMGVGAALMNAAEAVARQAGCKRLRVVTQHSNEAARRLYQKTGYNLVERSFVYHLWLT
jgi:ribosomal protein S18 acetylase RimI-like enzyme